MAELRNIIGYGKYHGGEFKIHALYQDNREWTTKRGKPICDTYASMIIQKRLGIKDVTCKRCLRILKIDQNFIKKDEFMI